MGLLSCGSKLIGFRLRAAATSRHVAEQLGRQQANLFCRVNVCACVYEYFSHVRFCWTTGISNLITPPAPDLRSLGRREGGAANCYLQHLKQHTITLSFHFPLVWLSGDTSSNLGLHAVAWEEPIGTIWSVLLLSRIIMQVLPFYDFLWAFYTELQRIFVDMVETVVLSNVKRTPDVPIRLNLLSAEIAWSWGHLLIFWIFSMCKMIATVDLPPTVNSTK